MLWLLSACARRSSRVLVQLAFAPAEGLLSQRAIGLETLKKDMIEEPTEDLPVSGGIIPSSRGVEAEGNGLSVLGQPPPPAAQVQKCLIQY